MMQEPATVAMGAPGQEELRLHSLVLGGIPVGVVLVRALDGVVAYANGRCERMLGHADGALRDVPVEGLLAGEAARAAALERREQGDEAPYELEVLRRDGSPMWCRACTSATDCPFNGRVWVTVLQDITAQKEAEARYAGIVATATDAIVSVDEGGRIVCFNQGAQEAFGYREEEVLGAPLDVLVPERFRTAYRARLRALATREVRGPGHGEARRAELWARRKGGEEFPVELAVSRLETTRGVLLTVVARDQTTHRRLEDEQRLLAEAGGVLASSSLEGDVALGRVVRLALPFLGDYGALDLLEEEGRVRCACFLADREDNQRLADALRGGPRARDASHLSREALATGRPVLLPQVPEEWLALAAPDAPTLRVLRLLAPRSLMAVPLRARERTLGALVFLSVHPARAYGADELRVAQALAWRVALAVDTARLYRRAQEATRMRDEVLGIVAHDLRSPLNTITLAARLLTRSLPAGEGRPRASLESILRSAQRMSRLIDDLLDVARLEGGALRVTAAPVDARALVLDALEAARAGAAEHRLELSLPDALPAVQGDMGRLLQVFANLVSNALKFTPLGGRVTLGAAAQGEGAVRFWVADTGAGLSAEQAGRVFERFWQAYATHGRQGAGLGLAISKGIVEAHGGRIWVDSKPGAGSTFCFTVLVWAGAR